MFAAAVAIETVGEGNVGTRVFVEQRFGSVFEILGPRVRPLVRGAFFVGDDVQTFETVGRVDARAAALKWSVPRRADGYVHLNT